MVYLTNSFNINMLSKVPAVLRVEEISLTRVKNILGVNEWVSAIGHESTAQFLSMVLGMSIPFNRIEIKASPGDSIIVFQLLKRLPEGKVLSMEELKSIPYRFFLVCFCN